MDAAAIAAEKRQPKSITGCFFDNLFAEIDLLTLYERIHLIHFGFHRLMTKQFPYAIYYKVIDSKAVVFRALTSRALRR